jgi:hypothetical protein
MWLTISLAFARPTDGTDLFSFDDTDEVVSFDSADGTVRVWYSVSGPNLVKSGDADADGIPDFVASVAASAEDVLEYYPTLGFRDPIPDGTSGGSPAMDVYLVDFAGNADGAYSAERCSGMPRVCSGYFVMENDFAGYGYSNLDTAVRVLTSHELFHAVQAAYDADLPNWLSEGTAVWAEQAFDPGNEDFVSYCDAYLDDTGRSLDEPPAAPVPVFAYATAIWWYFLTDRYGDDVLVELLEAGADAPLADMSTILTARGGSLADDWATFTQWNLATGRRAGAADSYSFASRIGPVKSEERADHIEDDNRYYPLAATYYELQHPGGPLGFALDSPAPELRFSLHPTSGDQVLPPLAAWSGDAPQDFGDLPGGSYWLVGANASLAENSTKVLTCLGGPDTVAACAPPDDTDVTDTGEPVAEDTDEPGGCSTVSAPWAGLLVAPLLRFRRRRTG